MLIRVNKSTSTRKPVKYAALSSGTISHVWYDEEASSAKRKNRILLTRESSKETPKGNFDA
ncbi:MAG: hypothetical protein WDN72_05925 [Alphaproteobacteria bacterium]